MSLLDGVLGKFIGTVAVLGVLAVMVFRLRDIPMLRRLGNVIMKKVNDWM